MKFASIAGLLLLASLLACGTPGVPLPPSLELPQAPQDLRASRKGDTVTLAWTVPRETTDHTNVRLRHLGPTRVCRSLTLATTKCADQVKEVDTRALLAASEAAAKAKAQTPVSNRKAQSTPVRTAPVIASATDTPPAALEQQHPTGFISYAVEALNSRGHSAGLSNQVQVPLAPTLPPPSDLAAKLAAEDIVLTFTGLVPDHEVPELHYACRIYRREKGSTSVGLVGEVPLSPSSRLEIVDRSFQWQKTYEYWVTVVTIVSPKGKTSAEVEGENSAPVTVFANDVFPPAAPSGLQAVFSGVGQQPFVDLTWAPNTDPDLAGYNVYRREKNGPWTRINSALLPTPAYRDGNVAAGRTYFYAVTALDVHGNESARSPEASETVPGAE
ncbi:MAG TPA: fibronectin type III domain-containing protein [Terriglobales bacterium]|nr:fibronectin type III domain-containing protein [Terriglobales bacterium]